MKIDPSLLTPQQQEELINRARNYIVKRRIELQPVLKKISEGKLSIELSPTPYIPPTPVKKPDAPLTPMSKAAKVLKTLHEDKRNPLPYNLRSKSRT
jgi:hypothetical protein